MNNFSIEVNFPDEKKSQEYEFVDCQHDNTSEYIIDNKKIEFCNDCLSIIN